MTTSHYVQSPYDVQPTKVEAPKTLAGTDLFPAVTLTATRAQVKKFGDVVEQEDELGTCLVAHFEVFGTLIVFYQSALDARNYWTVFVDMVNCVRKEQYPTKLGNAVVRRLTAEAIKPDWKNDEADTEYRSRRRKLTQFTDLLSKVINRANAPSGVFKSAPPRAPAEAANDWTMKRFASGSAGRFVGSGKAAPAKKAAAAKKAAPAKKAAAPKKSAAGRKVTPSKR